MARRRLQRRERQILIVGGIIAALIVGWIATKAPREAYRRSQTLADNARGNLAKAQTYHQEIQESRRRQAMFQQLWGKGGGQDLTTFLNGVVRKMDLYDRGAEVNTMQAGGHGSAMPAVKLTLKSVSMKELVDVLHAVYASEQPIILDQVQHIKPALNEKGLDCAIVFLAPRV